MTRKQSPNYLDSLLEFEAVMYEDSRERLGDAIELNQLMCESAEQLTYLFGQVPQASMDSRAKTTLTLLLSCRYHALAGVAAHLRGHSSDSHVYARKAMELCLFAVNMFENEKAVDAWLNAGEDYEEYRRQFKIMKMLDKDKHPGLTPVERIYFEALIDVYERCSNQVHATLPSVMPSVSFHWEHANSLRVGLKLVDSHEVRDKVFKLVFISLVDAGILAICLFGCLLLRVDDTVRLDPVEDVLNRIFRHPFWLAEHGDESPDWADQLQ